MMAAIVRKERLGWLMVKHNLHPLVIRPVTKRAAKAKSDTRVLTFALTRSTDDIAPLDSGAVKQKLIDAALRIVKGKFSDRCFTDEVFFGLDRLDHAELQTRLSAVFQSSHPLPAPGSLFRLRHPREGKIGLTDVLNGGGVVQFFNTLVVHLPDEGTLNVRCSPLCYGAAWDDWVIARVVRPGQMTPTRYACRVLAMFRILTRAPAEDSPVVDVLTTLTPFLLVERHESLNSELLTPDKLRGLCESVHTVAGIPLVAAPSTDACCIISTADVVEGAWAVQDPDQGKHTWILTEEFLGNYEYS